MYICGTITLWCARVQIKCIGNQPDAARQRADFDELTTTPFPKDNLISVFDLGQRSVRTFKDRPCLGTRTYLGTQKADPYHPQPAPRLPLARRLCSRQGPVWIARGCRVAPALA